MSDAHPTVDATPITPQAAPHPAEMNQSSADLAQSACSCEDKEHKEPVSTSSYDGVSASRAAPSAPQVTQSTSAYAPTISQLSCGCGGDSAPMIAYALGTLWFDFGTEARYDAIVQQLGSAVAGAGSATGISL